MFRQFCVAGLFVLLVLPVSARELDFSGYRWVVRSSEGREEGPGPNVFSGAPESADVDAEGRLHLFVRREGTRWTCSEVVLDRPLGYGSYEVEVETNPSEMDRQAVFGFFTYSTAAEKNHRELDVELSYWGEPSGQNAQFAVQPWSAPNSLNRFNVDHSNTRYTIRWTKDAVTFMAREVGGRVLHHWVRKENIPDPGDARIDMNMWLVKGIQPQNNGSIEFVIKRFLFIPESGLR